MPRKAASTIVGPPADALAEALESVAGDDLQLIAEYNSQRYEFLHVSDWILERHGGMEGVEEQSSSLFNYFHLDVLERDLLGDMLWLGEVGTFVTFLDHGIIVRAQTDANGIYVALDVTASVDDVQITIQNVLEETDDVQPR